MSVPLIGPDGHKYTLTDDSPEALEQARADGFHVEGEVSPHDIGEQQAQAAAAGAARGVTFGLSDVALGAGGEGEQGALKRLQEEHPIASGLGELAGNIVSPINAVGAAVSGPRAATTLGRIGQKAVGGAAVGTLFGAGQTVSDAALGDPEVTADKLIAHIGLGALLGAAGGGVGGAIEEGVAGIMPKLAKTASRAQSVLDDIANDATVRATRAQQGVINRLGETRTTEAGRALREHIGEKALPGPDDLLKSVESRIGKVGAEKGNILEVAEAGGAIPTHSEIGARLDELENGLNPIQRKLIGKDISELREGLAEISARPVGKGGPQGSGFRALDDLRQSVAKRGKFSRGAVGVDDETLQLKRQLAGVFRDEIDRQLVPQLGSDIGKHWADTKSLYGALKDAATLAKSGATRVKPSGLGFGLYDLLAGTAGAAVHPAGLAAALASKFAREHGPMLIAKAADALSKSSTLSTVAASFAKAIPATAPKMGPYGAALVNALAKSPASALATHMVLAQSDPGYAATAQTAGLTPEGPVEHTAALERAHGVMEVGTAASEGDKAIARGVQFVVRGSKTPPASSAHATQDFGAMRMRRGPEASHEQLTTEVRAMATNPDVLADRMAQNLSRVGQVAPAVSTALVARASRAVQYLAKECAVPPPPGPLAPEWRPNEAERHEFAQKVEVAREPLVVLEHAAAGTLTQQQVDTLRAIYPELAKHIADKTLEAAVGAKDMPYRSKMMLTLLTGVDVDGSMSQAVIAGNQQANRGTNKEPDAAPKPESRSSEMTLARRTALPQQQRELEMT